MNGIEVGGRNSGGSGRWKHHNLSNPRQSTRCMEEYMWWQGGTAKWNVQWCHYPMISKMNIIGKQKVNLAHCNIISGLWIRVVLLFMLERQWIQSNRRSPEHISLQVKLMEVLVTSCWQWGCCCPDLPIFCSAISYFNVKFSWAAEFTELVVT
jgi:hypothetical protein